MSVRLWNVSKKDNLVLTENNLKDTCHEGNNEQYERGLKVATSQVMAVAQQLAVNLEDNQEFSEEVYVNAKQMAHLNRETEQELALMFEGFQNIVLRLDKIRDASDEMERTGQASGLVMRNNLIEIVDIVSDIHQIDQSVRETMEMVNQLFELSGAITKILDTVADISAETQLLGFNASIEAARAGMAGAGFSVVAERIKKLSDDSRNSVKDIRVLIKQVLLANQNVKAKMEDTTEKVDHSVDKFQKIEDDLNAIETSFDSLTSKSREIRCSVKQERDNAFQIEQQFGDLRNKSQQGLDQVEAVYHSLKHHRDFIEELSDLGMRLNQAATTLQPMIVNENDLINLSEEIDHKAGDIACKLRDEALCLKQLTELNPVECTFLVKKLLNSHSFLEAAWVNDVKGRFVMSLPSAGIANAKVREWFVSSIAGKNFVSTPYISAITGRPCVTVSVPIYNKKGEIQGVLGVDLQC